MNENKFYKLLGARIRTARDNCWISQETLARELGLSRTSVTNIEAGRQKIQAHTLLRIADYLCTTMAALLPRKGD